MTLTLSDYTGFVGFGDSTVDSGNAAALTFGLATPASQGYWMGRFSTGPNYFDRLFAEITGQAPERFAGDRTILGADGPFGVNYAVGGSVTDDLAVQLAAFSSDLAGDAVLDAARIEDTLFGINIGGNDLLAFTAADGSPYTDAQLANLAAEVADDVGLLIDGLASLGAEAVLLSGVPNVGVTPDVAAVFGGDRAAALSANAPVTDAVNAALLAEVQTLIVADPALTVFWFVPDVGPLLEDPSAYDLDPALTRTPFVDDLAAGRAGLAEADAYAFLDDIHVTERVHDYLLDLALEATVFGGPSADTDNVVAGTALADRIDGFAGDDVIAGLGGADTLIGGSGADAIEGGAGADVIYGDAI